MRSDQPILSAKHDSCSRLSYCIVTCCADTKGYGRTCPYSPPNGMPSCRWSRGVGEGSRRYRILDIKGNISINR